MSRPFLLAQISDPHIGADWGQGDPARLVALDTTRPGEDPGELDAGRLEWLEAELSAAPDAPTILAMHHPPLVTGVPAWDRFGLAAEPAGFALHAILDGEVVSHVQPVR